MDIGWGTIVLSLCAALIGTAVGSGVVIYAQGIRNKKLRKIAISALDLLEGYAGTTTNKYTDAQNEFNKKFNMAQKRAILVALHKIGLPIEIPISGLSSIEHVTFLKKDISIQEIKDMRAQVKNGNCDHLFFSDVDLYFSEGLRRRAMRDIAKMFVENIMKKCSVDLTEQVVNYPKEIDSLTVGEDNIIAVFRMVTQERKFYDHEGKANTQAMDLLIKEIDRGLWDGYLGWDQTAYIHMKMQLRVLQNNALQPPKTIKDEFVEAFNAVMMPHAEKENVEGNSGEQ